VELGAITLKLNYDTTRIEITGVDMPNNGGEEPYFVVRRSSFVLDIGWMSLNPINVVEGEAVLLIHAKVKSTKYEVRSTKYGEPIRFTLDDDPISELADGEGNVLYDARLSVADAGFKVQGSRFGEDAGVVVYPNPAKDVLNVEFVTGNGANNITGAVTPRMASLQLLTMQGIVAVKQNLPDVKTGLNKTTMDVSKLPNGAYLLRFESQESTKVLKVIIQR
jgi:hypothetical protein